MSLVGEAYDDKFAKTRAALGILSKISGEWAGIPMPIDGEKLVINPRYPFAPIFMQPKPQESPQDKAAAELMKPRGSFWSTHRRCQILTWEDRTDPTKPKIQWGLIPGTHHLDQDLRTLGVSVAWSLEQENRALELLRKHLSEYAFSRYLLTGMFLETSERSGICYVFRRLRPTVALTFSNGAVRILAALCLHPIGYYANSWAGAMCPTDDVIAHLVLMRADEHRYWGKANQHPAYRPEAGL